jgi:50S ribosomal protein L16 3-hydroxylase
VVLDRRTRMMFDDDYVFINGESYRASGRDAVVLRQLADRRCLGADDLRRVGPDVLSLLACWCEAGWLHEGAPKAL